MKLLIGGSPCTYWSIAQTKNRETEASGMGWELFRNYVMARDKFQPDYFLYENNKSMSPAIREQITAILGVEPVLINSALVSAQNRQRLYWCGKREADGSYSTVPIEQPEDKGILLRDVLESGVCWREKAYTIDSNYYKTLGQQGFDRQSGRRKMVAEPVNITEDGKSQTLKAQYAKNSIANFVGYTSTYGATGVAEPVGINFLGSLYGQHSRWGVFGTDGKAPTLTASAGMGGGHLPMYPEPVKPLTEREMDYMVREVSDGRNHFDFGYIQDGTRDKGQCLTANVSKGVPYNVLCEPVGVGFRNRREDDGKLYRRFETHDEPKSNALTTVQTGSMVAEPVRIGTIENDAKRSDFDSQQYRVYSPDGKSVTLCGNGGGVGAKTGLYAVPAGMALRGRAENGNTTKFEMRKDGKANAVIVGHQSRLVIEPLAERERERESSGVTPMLRVREATKAGYTDIAPGECVDLAQENSKTRRGRRMAEKSNCLTTTCSFYEYCGTLDYPIYKVKDGQITIKGKQYPIKLRDGCYIIRKLTVTECKRLQTVPDDFVFPVSDSQAYKMLGNGWTVEVIMHILRHFDGITREPVDVFSMYDGMACGHIALDNIGANIRSYCATEIDKYAIKTAQYNFPDIVELGDAFNIRWDMEQEG